MPTTFQDEVFKQRLSKREIWINGDINDELIERLVVNLLALDETENDRREPRPIKVYINSQGGHVREALAAVDVMLSLNSVVETIAVGKALSAGLTILMGGQSRKAFEHSTFLFHAMRTSDWGILPDVESRIQHNKYLTQLTADLFGNRTKWSSATWLEILEGGRDRFFNSREALEIGLITDIIPRAARENGPAELPAPEAKPLLADPQASPTLEILTDGKVEIVSEEVPMVAQAQEQEKSSAKAKYKKHNKK